MSSKPVRPMPASPSFRDQFMYWAGRFHDEPDFDDQEREYKLVIANRLIAARRALANDEPDWLDHLDTAITAKPNNLTTWRATQPLQKWFREQPDLATVAFRLLWNDLKPVNDRMNDFVDVLATHGPGILIAETAFFHMAHDPYTYPMYRTEPVERAYDMARYPTPADNGIKDIGGRYQHFLMFLANVMKWAAERDLALSDPLDAQSVMWAVTFWVPNERWSDLDQKTFLAFQDSWKKTPARRTKSR